MEFKEIKKLIIDFGGTNYPTYWGCALGGEVGEAVEEFLELVKHSGKLQNILKKIERNSGYTDGAYWTDLADELSDVFIYIILIARRFNIDIEERILYKIQTVNSRSR